jgi:hypothetical protein
LVVSALGVAACSSTTPAPSGQPSLVIGVSGEELRTAFASIEIVTKVNGQVAKDTTVTRDANGVLPLPTEIEVSGKAGDPVEVTVQGYGPPVVGTRTLDLPPGQVELLKRTATTRMPAEKKLLRLALDARCAAFNGLPTTCNTGETCVTGRCESDAVSVQALEPYVADWATNAPDICRPSNAGAPELVLGKGQTEYYPLTPNEVVQLELGPQGGHHLWVAVRMKNLKQAGSRTAISGVQPDTGLKAAPTAFVFTFDKDEGGYCKLYGLRFQVDAGGDLGTTYKAFLGKPLDLTVEVTDVSGRKATAQQRVMIADKLLCPDGTSSCNTP